MVLNDRLLDYTCKLLVGSRDPKLNYLNDNTLESIKKNLSEVLSPDEYKKTLKVFSSLRDRSRYNLIKIFIEKFQKTTIIADFIKKCLEKDSKRVETILEHMNREFRKEGFSVYQDYEFKTWEFDSSLSLSDETRSYISEVIISKISQKGGTQLAEMFFKSIGSNKYAMGDFNNKIEEYIHTQIDDSNDSAKMNMVVRKMLDLRFLDKDEQKKCILKLKVLLKHDGYFLTQSGSSFEILPLDGELSHRNKEDVYLTMEFICDKFKESVENDLWRNIYSDQEMTISKNETKVQPLFKTIASIYCLQKDLDITAEAKSPRGPVDFKFSRGAQKVSLVEIKMSYYSELEHTITTQVPIYMKGLASDKCILLIIDVSGGKFVSEIKPKLDELISKSEYKIKLVVVNASPLGKESASVATSVN